MKRVKNSPLALYQKKPLLRAFQKLREQHKKENSLSQKSCSERIRKLQDTDVIASNERDLILF